MKSSLRVNTRQVFKSHNIKDVIFKCGESSIRSNNSSVSMTHDSFQNSFNRYLKAVVYWALL